MKEKFYRWKAKRDLINKYGYLIEVDNLLEEYETEKLLHGNLNEQQLANSRKELLQIQYRLESEKKFLDFLKNI